VKKTIFWGSSNRATSRVTNQVPVLFPPCDILLLLNNWVRGGCSKLSQQPARTDVVTAVRKGHWVTLDERNLAPSEVLEMLNRLLDDNRELMVPNTQEVIKRHPDFAIFATQNPSGVYVSMRSRQLPARFSHQSNAFTFPGMGAAKNFQRISEADLSRCTSGKYQTLSL
jgi:hypothetical protein